MLFNSFEFAVFLPLVFALYWFVFQRNFKIQNLLLVVVSYVFYGWWDWRFLSLIVISSLLDFGIGQKLGSATAPKARKALLGLSLAVNLGFLGFFKYFNFFVESFVDAFATVGVSLSPTTLQIVLPVGISFYTFQTLSYTIDVYRKELEPSKDLVGFLAFVSFFPQLVAGPIERAKNLLPQFAKARTFDYHQATQGMKHILWGFFKKVVIADTCGIYADYIFGHHEALSGGSLVLGALCFTFQIYGDFSGYSDIAIGTAKLFGFNLMTNFRTPYFSRDIAEFWRRWHISLSTWFRDYVYIPLGGSRGGQWGKVRNTFIIFVVSGFWHGANWTFVVWGFLNALYFLPLLLLKQNRKNLGVVAEGRWLPSVREFGQVGLTFGLTVFAWIFFRAANVGEAFSYIGGLFSGNFIPSYAEVRLYAESGAFNLALLGALVGVLLLFEWAQRHKDNILDFENLSTTVRWGLYIFILLLIVFFGTWDRSTFIYFQF